MKIPYTVRLPRGLLQSIKENAKKKGVSVTELFENALSAYIRGDVNEPELHDLQNRLNYLEMKFHELNEDDEHQDISFNKSGKKIDSSGIGELTNVDASELGELITIEEISKLTGYSVPSVRSKLARLDITPVKASGESVFYKDEIIKKLGFK